VEGATSLTCPECGSDLTRVGIVGRKSAGVRDRIGAWGVTGATLVLMFWCARTIADRIEGMLPVLMRYDEHLTATFAPGCPVRSIEVSLRTRRWEAPMGTAQWVRRDDRDGAVAHARLTTANGQSSSRALDVEFGTFPIHFYDPRYTSTDTRVLNVEELHNLLAADESVPAELLQADWLEGCVNVVSVALARRTIVMVGGAASFGSGQSEWDLEVIKGQPEPCNRPAVRTSHSMSRDHPLWLTLSWYGTWGLLGVVIVWRVIRRV
jgi:hypothetical protein